MNPQTAQFLATTARLFWNDPNLEAWYGIERRELLVFITQLTGRENVEDAIELLEQIAAGRFAPTIPPNLKELVNDLEALEKKTREEPYERDEAKVLATRAFLRWKKLAAEDKLEPLIPVPAKESERGNAPPIQSPTTPVGRTEQPSVQQDLERVLLTVKRDSRPLVAEVAHFVGTLPARVIKLTLDLGRDALAKADPNVETFVLLWREGITSKALKSALSAAVSTTTDNSTEALSVLTKQAEALENYEKSHPFLVRVLSALHRSDSLSVGINKFDPGGIKEPEKMTPDEIKNTLVVEIDKGKETIEKVQKLEKPKFFQQLAGGILNNPVTRAASSPARNLLANLLTRLRILTLRAPVEIGQAVFFPGSGGTNDDQKTGGIAGAGGVTMSFFFGKIGSFASGIFSKLLGPLLRIGARFVGPLLKLGFGFLGTAFKFLFGGLGAGAGIFGAVASGVGAIGSAIGGAAAAGGAFLASGAGLMALTIGAVFGLPIILTLININTNQRAYLERSATSGSLYIAIEKVSSETILKNEDLPKTITYVLRVLPKRGPLKDVEIQDVVTQIDKNGSKTLGGNSWTAEKIESPWSQRYTFEITGDMTDSLIVNTVTVAASVEDGSPRQTETTVRTVIVGNPPQECPSGWPVASGNITQGPGGATSHRGKEALDIGGPNIAGDPVLTTHKGITTIHRGDPTGGNYVEVTGTCNGKQITTRYLHLANIDPGLRGNQEIPRGTQVGQVGSTGRSSAPHLHYEFAGGALMAPPLIPKSIPESCDGNCGVTIP